MDDVDSCENLAYLDLFSSPPGTSKLLLSPDSGYFVSKSKRRLHFSDSEVRRSILYKVNDGTQTEPGLINYAHATRREERKEACRQVAKSLIEMADDFEQYLLKETTSDSYQTYWFQSSLLWTCLRNIMCHQIAYQSI